MSDKYNPAPFTHVVGWLYQFEGREPVFSSEKKDWAETNPRWKEIALNDASKSNLRVRPLEWRAANEGFGHGRTHYGSGVFGHWYGVKRVKTGVWECFHHVGGKVEHLRHQVSLDDAKAAAQADYVSRMLSALAPSPQPKLRGQDADA